MENNDKRPSISYSILFYVKAKLKSYNVYYKLVILVHNIFFHIHNL